MLPSLVSISKIDFPFRMYVLERFFNQGFEDGYGLMVSMGPGFCSEMVLLEMKNN